MKRYERHIFVCENRRPDDHPKGCCALKNSIEVRSQFKKRLKELGLSTQFRANSAGCLDACKYGATVLVYPEQIWYGNVTIDDVEEIIQEHLLKDNPVERLKIKDKKFNKDEKNI
jgi:(2Fe-2S) ferredoxin